MTGRRWTVLVALMVVLAAAMWWLARAPDQDLPKPLVAAHALAVVAEKPAASSFSAPTADYDRSVPYCETAATCGLSAGCDNHRCLPCTSSSTCLGSELCAKGRCLEAGLVGCGNNENCGPNEFGHLDSETGLARGNEGVMARCLSKSGGKEVEEPTVFDDQPRKFPWDNRGERLMDALQKKQAKGE